MKITNYILLFLIFLSASCNKETAPTSVNGTVRDATTNAAVADAEVGLFETDGESSFGLGGTLLEEKCADASGEFSFDFSARENYQYYVHAIKEQYWNNQTDNITFVEDLGNENVLKVSLYPEAILKIHIIDTLPYFENSEFRANFFGGSIQINGYQLDTVFRGTVYGNGYFDIFCVVEDIPINFNNIFEATIYCSAFDTTYYEILY
ncbi:MAG: hypothetical protein H7Y00_13740 [Fimbriimonadaceae bacterium]|nr:hypothetical protein [Chitinophagales bacterium]